MKYVYIGDNENELLDYVVTYLKARLPINQKRQASRQAVANQLILAYAKQLASGIPEDHWRANMIYLINECEIEQ